MKRRIPWSRRAALTALAGITALACAAGTAIAATSGAGHETGQTYSPAGIGTQLAKARVALAKYQDVAVAGRDGYHPAGPCESTATDPGASWWGGAMGVHFVNDAISQSGTLDAEHPAVLLYLPDGKGGMQLLGAEYFRADSDQELATDGDRPTLFGRAFDGPMLGHAPGMPKHYDLHVWLFRHNPSGMFAPWNPDVSCPS